jgi:hypothetical protein
MKLYNEAFINHIEDIFQKDKKLRISYGKHAFYPEEQFNIDTLDSLKYSINRFREIEKNFSYVVNCETKENDTNNIVEYYDFTYDLQSAFKFIEDYSFYNLKTIKIIEVKDEFNINFCIFDLIGFRKYALDFFDIMSLISRRIDDCNSGQFAHLENKMKLLCKNINGNLIK